MDFSVTFVRDCTTVNNIIVPSNFPVAEQYTILVDQPLTITIDPFETVPSGCEISYGHYVKAAIDDSFVDLSGELTFDSSTLTFTFSTND